jgi:DNA-binding XRE family transcriptional regulator
MKKWCFGPLAAWPIRLGAVALLVRHADVFVGDAAVLGHAACGPRRRAGVLIGYTRHDASCGVEPGVALARAVRAERARAGLTQAQVAERMGVDASAISQIERLARRVYMDEVPELCEALGTTLADLLAKAPVDDRRKMGV